MAKFSTGISIGICALLFSFAGLAPIPSLAMDACQGAHPSDNLASLILVEECYKRISDDADVVSVYVHLNSISTPGQTDQMDSIRHAAAWWAALAYEHLNRNFEAAAAIRQAAGRDRLGASFNPGHVTIQAGYSADFVTDFRRIDRTELAEIGAEPTATASQWGQNQSAASPAETPLAAVEAPSTRGWAANYATPTPGPPLPSTTSSPRKVHKNTPIATLNSSTTDLTTDNIFTSIYLDGSNQEAERVCLTSDASENPTDVVVYCTKADIAYAVQSRNSKSGEYRDLAQIAMAILAFKLSEAHQVLDDGKSSGWRDSSKSLLTQVSQHGLTTKDRVLATKILDWLVNP